MNLLDALKESVFTGLKRSAIKKCSQWAQEYRVMGQPFPGKWTFDHHPWVRELHDRDTELVIGQKAAQMGYTEVALNKVFYFIDILGVSCLYVLPASKPDATDFSKARFSPALENSAHLSKLFSDVQNVSHKRAGDANLYIRGSRSRAQLKSIPVGLIIYDEVDEMVQANIQLGTERMSGQLTKQDFRISTPTIAKFGINLFFENSTQEHYFFQCPHCSKLTQLTFPECLVITADDPFDKDIYNSYLICNECKHILDHKTKIEWLKAGIWVPKHPDRISSGFNINQLYSMTIRPFDIAISYLNSLTDQTNEQEFYNSKLGIPRTVKDAQVTEAQLEEATANYRMGPQGGLTVMGIDVGKWLHYEIANYHLNNLPAAASSSAPNVNSASRCRVLAAGKVESFEELGKILEDYGVIYAVIDANPERRKALEFAQRYWGRVKLCFYGNSVNGKQIHVHSEEEHTITVDRTSWLDMSLGRFRNHTISLPYDLPLEYKQQQKALIRIYKKDADGNPIGKYEKGATDDHLAHARNYCELALTFAASVGKTQNIQDVF